MKFICTAGRTEQFSGAAAVGIGSLAAAAGLMKALLAPETAGAAGDLAATAAGKTTGAVGDFAGEIAGEAPQIGQISEIIFIGSCGMYDPAAPLLAVHEFSAAAAISAAELAGRAYRPISAPAAALNSLEAITASAEDAAAFARAGFVAENMEAAGIFAAAAALGIPARCVLVAANHVGPHAHEQYVANLAAIRAQITTLIATHRQ